MTTSGSIIRSLSHNVTTVANYCLRNPLGWRIRTIALWAQNYNSKLLLWPQTAESIDHAIGQVSVTWQRDVTTATVYLSVRKTICWPLTSDSVGQQQRRNSRSRARVGSSRMMTHACDSLRRRSTRRLVPVGWPTATVAPATRVGNHTLCFDVRLPWRGVYTE